MAYTAYDPHISLLGIFYMAVNYMFCVALLLCYFVIAGMCQGIVVLPRLLSARDESN